MGDVLIEWDQIDLLFSKFGGVYGTTGYLGTVMPCVHTKDPLSEPCKWMWRTTILLTTVVWHDSFPIKLFQTNWNPMSLEEQAEIMTSKEMIPSATALWARIHHGKRLFKCPFLEFGPTHLIKQLKSVSEEGKMKSSFLTKTRFIFITLKKTREKQQLPGIFLTFHTVSFRTSGHKRKSCVECQSSISGNFLWVMKCPGL